ncbi:unnamed protein product, partial [Symbiodinium sp. CCMP2592]
MHTPASRRWQYAETPKVWKLQREGSASSNQMPAASVHTPVDEEVQAEAPDSESSSSSCTSRPSPTDTASKKKKKKSKKNKKQRKNPPPGFDPTLKPGEEKNHVLSFMQRLKHAPHGNNSPHQLGICYYTVEVKEGYVCCHQSTLVVTAEDRNGDPYAWSGQEFKGEVVRKKAWAENAAARVFLADAAVRQTAENMDPAYARKQTESQKRRLPKLREFRRAKRAAAAAAARQRRPCICWHVWRPPDIRTLLKAPKPQ